MNTPVEPTRPPPPAARERLDCGGHAVSIETYPPSGKDRGATSTILLLHDANGVGQPVRAEAAVLAEAGFQVVLPHYLDSTGQARAGFSEIAPRFEAWREGVAAILGHVRARPETGLVALCGRSLGGALALAVALDTAGLSAVVVRSAFLPPEMAERALALPPVLALHGARDAIVQPSHAEALAAGIGRAGGRCEIVLYPDQAHGFDAAADADATARMLAFLKAHLTRSCDRSIL